MDWPTPYVPEGDTPAYKGIRINVHRMEFPTRSGGLKKRDIVVHPGAVVILPLLDAETVLLIQNKRVAVNDTLWELPAGTLEKGEDPVVTAGRELVEEAGYECEKLLPLTAFYTSPGILNEIIYAYLATDLTEVGQQLEDGEEIEVFPTPMNEALEMVRDGRIRDGKTISALLYFNSFGAVTPEAPKED